MSKAVREFLLWDEMPGTWKFCLGFLVGTVGFELLIQACERFDP